MAKTLGLNSELSWHDRSSCVSTPPITSKNLKVPEIT